jgi:hypothetical protein
METIKWIGSAIKQEFQGGLNNAHLALVNMSPATFTPTSIFIFISRC